MPHEIIVESVTLEQYVNLFSLQYLGIAYPLNFSSGVKTIDKNSEKAYERKKIMNSIIITYHHVS